MTKVYESTWLVDKILPMSSVVFGNSPDRVRYGQVDNTGKPKRKTDMNTKIIVNGCEGKMGKALLACVPSHPGIEVLGKADIGGNMEAVLALGHADVVVDFSSHTATPALVDLCRQWCVALVIGTTGHSDAEKVAIVASAGTIPIVISSNFSTGVNTLFWLTRKAAEILGPGFDLEIVETHHRLKKDAPSGTAKTLAQILAEVMNRRLEDAVRNGRVGNVGERTSGEIGIHSVRGGDVVGDHTVLFATVGERLELTHKASSRETFANGALRAAKWVVEQKPGLYSMMDVLGLK